MNRYIFATKEIVKPPFLQTMERVWRCMICNKRMLIDPASGSLKQIYCSDKECRGTYHIGS